MKINKKIIAELTGYLKEFNLSEIEYSDGTTKVKVSKLAQGLPVGGEIESLDDGTLFSAFKNRTGIKVSSD